MKDMIPRTGFHRRFFSLLTAGLLTAAVLLAGCSDNKTPNFPVNVGGITLEEKPATVASLNPSITEILYGIGAGDQLVGRSENDACNGEVRLLPSVGTTVEPDLAKLTELKPSLVLTSYILDKDLQALTEAGIPVAVLPTPTSIAALRQRILDIGALLRGNNKGPKLVEAYLTKFDNEIEYVRTKLAGVTRKTGVFVLSMDGSVATGDTLLGEILKTAGVDNVAEGFTGYRMPAADLKTANPQVILCSNPPGIQSLSLIDSVKDLPALAAASVYELDYQFADRYSAEITFALYAIAYALYPEAMSAPDPAASSGQTSSAFEPTLSIPTLLDTSGAAAAASDQAASAAQGTVSPDPSASSAVSSATTSSMPSTTASAAATSRK